MNSPAAALSASLKRPPLTPWRGATCIPNGLPGSPYGDGQRIWTPAYAVYDANWRSRMREAYLGRGYTHFVYLWCGTPYGPDYPAIPYDPVRPRRDLLELRADGLQPVVVLTDESTGARTDYVKPFIDACGDLIQIQFPQYEMNMAVGGDTLVNGQWVGQTHDMLTAFKSWLPYAEQWVHFTPGHGAGGSPEPDWWGDMVTQGLVTGLLSQDDQWNSASDTATGLQSTCDRLVGSLGQQARLDWPTFPGQVVNFEACTTPLYHDGWTEAQGIAFMNAVTGEVAGLSGFCDSGR